MPGETAPEILDLAERAGNVLKMYGSARKKNQWTLAEQC